MPYTIVEVKQTKLKDGKEQLRSYTHATGAPIALWSNGAQTIVWHRKNPTYFVELPALPTASQTIDDVAGQPWTIETLVEKEKDREREGAKARSLRDLIVDLEDEVLANAGVDVFEEVFKLIFTKLYDEMACYRGTYKHLRFRNSNTAAQLKSAIQTLFDDHLAASVGLAAAPTCRSYRIHMACAIGSKRQTDFGAAWVCSAANPSNIRATIELPNFDVDALQDHTQ